MAFYEFSKAERARVRNTLMHLLGQISYKKGRLTTVINDMKNLPTFHRNKL